MPLAQTPWTMLTVVNIYGVLIMCQALKLSILHTLSHLILKQP